MQTSSDVGLETVPGTAVVRRVSIEHAHGAYLSRIWLMATITATYGALELSSSQTVQVTNPAPATLVHRYSFSETSGTNAADAIAGPAWNGWLPRDGAFNGSGQLTLASSLQQYVELPAVQADTPITQH